MVILSLKLNNFHYIFGSINNDCWDEIARIAKGCVELPKACKSIVSNEQKLPGCKDQGSFCSLFYLNQWNGQLALG